MNQIFELNMAVVAERWPGMSSLLQAQDIGSLDAELREGIESTLVINGVQLSSRHDRIAEARLQSSIVDGDAHVVHLYGPGLGELPLAFLSRAGLKRLEVHILNEAIFALVLHLVDQRGWLDDPRVSLTMAGDHRNIASPCFASPPELVLASEFNAKIRDQLVASLMVSFVNNRFAPDSPVLQARFESNKALIRNDCDVSDLFGSRPGGEVWVVATGPSLATQYAYLRSAKMRSEIPLLIAVDTALVPLLDNGVRPDMVVSVDQLTSIRTLPPVESKNLPLVYFPMLDNEVLAAWQGTRYAAYSPSALYAELLAEIPRGVLYAGGSVLHAAVDLAVKMGAQKIVLFGADFALVGDQGHAGWLAGELAPRYNTSDWVLNGHGQRVKTLLNLRSYLCTLEHYIAAHPAVQFFNTSREGALIQGAAYHPEFVK